MHSRLPVHSPTATTVRKVHGINEEHTDGTSTSSPSTFLQGFPVLPFQGPRFHQTVVLPILEPLQPDPRTEHCHLLHWRERTSPVEVTRPPGGRGPVVRLDGLAFFHVERGLELRTPQGLVGWWPGERSRSLSSLAALVKVLDQQDRGPEGLSRRRRVHGGVKGESLRWRSGKPPHTTWLEWMVNAV